MYLSLLRYRLMGRNLRWRQHKLRIQQSVPKLTKLDGKIRFPNTRNHSRIRRIIIRLITNLMYTNNKFPPYHRRRGWCRKIQSRLRVPNIRRVRLLKITLPINIRANLLFSFRCRCRRRRKLSSIHRRSTRWNSWNGWHGRGPRIGGCTREGTR